MGPTVVAQLTDPHIVRAGQLLFGKVDTPALLAAAVAHVNALRPRPALAIATGDLTDAAAPDQYDNLADLLGGLELPWVVLPGNHDDTEQMAARFPRAGEVAPLDLGWQFSMEVGPLRVVAIDTRIPGSPAGRLGPERLAWLDDTLAAHPEPTIVAMHHPPFVTGIQHMDAMGLEDPDALGAVIERHPHVLRIISGHLHRNITTGWHGTVVTTSPSTAHQVALDLTEGAARWNREPPAVHLHVWLPDEATLVTHTSAVGDFGPMEPFGG